MLENNNEEKGANAQRSDCCWRIVNRSKEGLCVARRGAGGVSCGVRKKLYDNFVVVLQTLLVQSAIVVKRAPIVGRLVAVAGACDDEGQRAWGAVEAPTDMFFELKD